MHIELYFFCLEVKHSISRRKNKYYIEDMIDIIRLQKFIYVYLCIFSISFKLFISMLGIMKLMLRTM